MKVTDWPTHFLDKNKKLQGGNTLQFPLQFSALFSCKIQQEFNTGGKLYDPYDKKYKNTFDINRNTEGWVEAVEKNCSYSKVIKFLNNKLGKKHNLLLFKKAVQQFNRDFIFNSNKDFTIRDLANQIKHNHSVKLKEFYSPMDFTVDINNEQINLKRNQLGIKLKTDFYDLKNPEKVIGNMKVNYFDDLYIDIEYANGEQFFAKDYIRQNLMLSLDSIYTEMTEYREAIIDLYECLIRALKPSFIDNPMLKKPNLNKKTINIDSYFKR